MADNTGKQVKNGKAFEYALLIQYVDYLRSIGVMVKVEEDKAYKNAKLSYEGQTPQQKLGFDESARATIETIIQLEPGLTATKGPDDVLIASLATDAMGQAGDVRDVIFKRPLEKWEVGFSAKNNHEAVKHSRLSDQNDFGEAWFGFSCTATYWKQVNEVFDKVKEYKAKSLTWRQVPNKSQDIYVPLLKAFREEVLRLNDQNPTLPQKLIMYLIGRYPFYKIIKEDRFNLVVVRAFNLVKGLNKSVNGVSARYKTPNLKLPTRIVEFELKKGSDTTLIMILDEGWEISFRLHNADEKINPSLKFDIQLLGNPPVLFTQHLFQ